MKKLLSLLAILGLVGSVAMPIYAQEEDVNSDDELLVAAVEDIDADSTLDDEIDYGVDEEEIADGSAYVEEEVLDLEENVDDSIDDVMGKLDEEIELSEDGKAALERLLNGEGSEEDAKIIIHEWAVEMGLTDEQATMLAGLLLGLGLGGLLVIGIISIILRILGIIALWKAFNRAGEGGWKAIIPIYCSYIKYKLAGMKNWFWYGLLIAVIFGIIAAFIPDQQKLLTDIATAIVGIIYVVVKFKFARKYGWGVFTSILFVLFYPICILILGFGNYKYEGKSKETVVEA